MKISENENADHAKTGEIENLKKWFSAAYTENEVENCSLYGKRDEKRRFMAKRGLFSPKRA